MDLNNREIAVLVWSGVVLLWMTLRRDMRGPLWNVVKTLARPPILFTWMGYLAWVFGLTLVAASIGIWNPALLGDTVLSAAASFALLFHSEEALERDDYFRRKVARALRVTVLIEVYVNLVVLPLVVELALVPIVTFLTMVSAYAATDDRYQAARQLVDGFLIWSGLALLAYVTLKLASNPDLLNETAGLRFAVPLWISLGVLPYLYLLALYAGYDSAFRRINFSSADSVTRRRAKWALVARCRLRARRLGDFRGAWIHSVVQAEPDETGDELLSKFSPRSDHAEAA